MSFWILTLRVGENCAMSMRSFRYQCQTLSELSMRIQLRRQSWWKRCRRTATWAHAHTCQAESKMRCSMRRCTKRERQSWRRRSILKNAKKSQRSDARERSPRLTCWVWRNQERKRRCADTSHSHTCVCHLPVCDVERLREAANTAHRVAVEIACRISYVTSLVVVVIVIAVVVVMVTCPSK